MAHKRRTLRVLVTPDRPDVRLDLFDEKFWLIKWRKITTEGLLHTNDKLLERGPVTVPDIQHYRHLIREGFLVAFPEE